MTEKSARIVYSVLPQGGRFAVRRRGPKGGVRTVGVWEHRDVAERVAATLNDASPYEA